MVSQKSESRLTSREAELKERSAELKGTYDLRIQELKKLLEEKTSELANERLAKTTNKQSLSNI